MTPGSDALLARRGEPAIVQMRDRPYHAAAAAAEAGGDRVRSGRGGDAGRRCVCHGAQGCDSGRGPAVVTATACWLPRCEPGKRRGARATSGAPPADVPIDPSTFHRRAAVCRARSRARRAAAAVCHHPQVARRGDRAVPPHSERRAGDWADVRGGWQRREAIVGPCAPGVKLRSGRVGLVAAFSACTHGSPGSPSRTCSCAAPTPRPIRPASIPERSTRPPCS